MGSWLRLCGDPVSRRTTVLLESLPMQCWPTSRVETPSRLTKSPTSGLWLHMPREVRAFPHHQCRREILAHMLSSCNLPHSLPPLSTVMLKSVMYQTRIMLGEAGGVNAEFGTFAAFASKELQV